ncbi:hypothetical protein AQ436_06560 [Arthrobacter sp. EpRS66]|nr:hypothetical protein AQ436_06560 [Arthrobacter sp. EpRS66]
MQIGFLVPWPLNPDLTAFWSMAATVATAVGTFLLAFFAWKAWKSAKETLKGQQSAIELSALGDYVKALNTMQRLSKSTPAEYMPPPHPQNTAATEFALRRGAYSRYIESLCNDVEIAGHMWRIHHGELDPFGNLFQKAEQVLREAQARRLMLDENEASVQFRLNASFSYAIELSAMLWQESEASRKSVLMALDNQIGTFVAQSPANLSK